MLVPVSFSDVAQCEVTLKIEAVFSEFMGVIGEVLYKTQIERLDTRSRGNPYLKLGLVRAIDRIIW